MTAASAALRLQTWRFHRHVGAHDDHQQSPSVDRQGRAPSPSDDLSADGTTVGDNHLFADEEASADPTALAERQRVTFHRVTKLRTCAGEGRP